MYDNDEQPVKLPGYRVDALTDAAIRFVDAHQDEPFFLFISYLEPHHQNHLDDYVAPDGYRERYAGRWTPPDLAALGGSAQQHLGGYYGMVKRLDEALGRLLDALKSLGLADNTIVMFTSDHGSHFKTRNAEYKRSCHEAAVRIPTAFQRAGFEGGGQVRQTGQPGGSAADAARCGGLARAAGDGWPIDPAAAAQWRTAWAGVDWPEEVFIQISESQVGRAIRTSAGSTASMRPICTVGRPAARITTSRSTSTICRPIRMS